MKCVKAGSLDMISGKLWSPGWPRVPTNAQVTQTLNFTPLPCNEPLFWLLVMKLFFWHFTIQLEESGPGLFVVTHTVHKGQWPTSFLMSRKEADASCKNGLSLSYKIKLCSHQPSQAFFWYYADYKIYRISNEYRVQMYNRCHLIRRFGWPGARQAFFCMTTIKFVKPFFCMPWLNYRECKNSTNWT